MSWVYGMSLGFGVQLISSPLHYNLLEYFHPPCGVTVFSKNSQKHSHQISTVNAA